MDADLGIQNAMLIPNTNLLVGGGKEGVMYLLDRDNMGHFRSGNNGQIVQSFQASSAARMNGAPVYWNSPTYGPAIYVWPAGDPLKVFRLVGGVFTTPASAQSSALAAPGMPGGMLSLSANGGTAGTGILWATMSRAGDANHTPQPGILRAYDAGNVTRELWNSQQNAARDSARQLREVHAPDRGEREGLRGQPVEQAGGLWIDWSRRRQRRRRSSARARTRTSRRRRTTTLIGTATDDGNPVPPGQLTTTWSLASGPAAVTFSAPNALSTNATFSVPGTYTIRLSAFDGQATASDDVSVTVEAPAGSGTGLLAQYFNDAGSGIYFTALVLTRTDATVDFDWASGAPDPAVQADNFSVRWSGEVKAPVTGTYTFTTTSDDGVRLYVNGQLLIDNWTDHARGAEQRHRSRSSPIRGTRSGWTSTTARMLATARLSWAYPGQNLQIVPQWALYPAPACQSASHRRCGWGQDGHAARRRLARRRRARRWSAGPSLTTTWSKISGREDSAGGTVTFGNPNAPVDDGDVRRRRHLRAAAHGE